MQDEIMGRQHGDAERLFPRVTHASAATTGEVTVNGKTLKLWTFGQLEALNNFALRQRAMAIRDAIGEVYCPPMPSAQPQDLVRWILHVQSELTDVHPQPGRANDIGLGHTVPPAFAQDTKARPISMNRAEPQREQGLPFGPRAGQDHDATRDHYSDLKFQRKEFKEAPVQGIQSLRLGGEGRKHLFPKENMVASGVSSSGPVGIQTMKPGGEGRRFIDCHDHLFEQKRDLEAHGNEPAVPSPRQMSPRCTPNPVRHVSETNMSYQGLSEPRVEAPLVGDRKRHMQPQDHMMTQGISIGQRDEDIRSGRKYLDSFAGSRTNFRDTNNYQSNWKKDPSKLYGSSLLC